VYSKYMGVLYCAQGLNGSTVYSDRMTVPYFAQLLYDSTVHNLIQTTDQHDIIFQSTVIFLNNITKTSHSRA